MINDYGISMRMINDYGISMSMIKLPNQNWICWRQATEKAKGSTKNEKG